MLAISYMLSKDAVKILSNTDIAQLTREEQRKSR
jgi:hypothetical protein